MGPVQYDAVPKVPPGKLTPITCARVRSRSLWKRVPAPLLWALLP
jgi:hypothetical protein